MTGFWEYATLHGKGPKPEPVGPQDPPAAQQGPYIPPSPPPLVFDTFAGLNTNASRPGIEDQQMYVCDGFFPLGKNNLRTLPGVGGALYTAPDGLTIAYYDFANLGSTPLCVVFLSDGSLVQVNTSTKVTTSMAPAGTIASPAIGNVSVSQWGSQYVIIVAKQTNGLWLWDGSNLFTSGTLGPDITIANSGLDYVSEPLITAWGGSGVGSTFTAVVDGGLVQSITCTNPGSGYGGNDMPILVFAAGGSPGSTAVAMATVTSGTITAVSVLSGGLGYTPSVQATVLGGGGAGATVSVTQSGGSVTGVSVTDAGEGYSTSDPPSIFITDPNNPVCQAYIDTMPFGVGGTTSENFHTQLWIGNGPRIQFTAPGSITDFATSDGGGAFQSTDSFLRRAFSNLRQVNGFLYLMADSSLNYISGVNTSTPQGETAPVTTFQNVNVSPEVGTPWVALDVWDQGLVFGNSFGIHVSFGGNIKKVSEPLDGIYNSVPNFGGFSPSSAKAIIYGKKVWMILLPVIDQITGQQVNKLFMWNGKLWFTSQQDVNLVFIKHQEIDSVITAYGTNGGSIYPLFQNPSTGFTKSVQSKLWDNPSYIMTKTASRLFGLVNYYSDQSPELEISIDNESGVAPQDYNLLPNPMSWINDDGDPIAWENNSSQPITWLQSNPTGVVVFPPTEVGQQGALLGLTLSTSAADMALISLTIVDENWGYRG